MKKSYILQILLVGIILVSAFLNLQMDDEIYYNLYDFESIPEEIDGYNGVITIKEEYGLEEGAVIAEIPPLHLPKGECALEVSHEGDSDISVQVLNGSELLYTLTLPGAESNSILPFTLKEECYHLNIFFRYAGHGTAVIKHAYLRGNRFFYADSILYAGLLIAIILILGHYLRKKRYWELPRRTRLLIFLTILFAIWLNYPHYNSFMQQGQDMRFHLSRIEGIKNELLRGQIPVQLYSDGLGGRGMIGSLYPSLFLYFSAFLRLLGASVVAAFNVTEILFNLMTMFFAWYCGYRLTKSRTGAFFSMVIYCTMSYRITAVYFHQAVGEAFAVAFIPLIIAGLYDVLEGEKERWPVLALGISGILESHTLSTIMWALVCLIFGIVYLRRLFREKRVIAVIKAAGLTLVLNLGMLIPFLKYYRSDINISGTMGIGNFSSAAIFPTQLFMILSGSPGFPTNSISKGIAKEQTLSLGIAVLVCAAFMLWYLFVLFGKGKDRKVLETEEKEGYGDSLEHEPVTELEASAHALDGVEGDVTVHGDRRFLLCLFAVGLWFLFMSTTWFPWETLQKFDTINSIVRMFQFPIRFGEVASPCILFAGYAALFRLSLKKDIRNKILIGVGIASLLGANLLIDTVFEEREMHVTQYRADIQDQLLPDYVPKGYDKDNFPSEPVSEGAEILNYERKGTSSSFQYSADSDTFVDLPVIFFEGYEARDDNGTLLTMSKGEYGALRVMLPKASGGHVQVKYVQPGYFYLAYLISIITAIAFLIYRILVWRKALKARKA
ncbi:MAG: hypothetical protein K5989_09190 [Lachnospiraceae bacterium]|nr:hypothetical protein [Lachnospiraceae bacterium]